MIDVKSLMTTTFDKAIDTVRIPCPTGEYTAQIGTGPDDIAIEEGTSGLLTKNPGRPWARLDVNLTISDPSGSLQAATGRSPMIVRDGIMLDLDSSGGIDLTIGKNTRLGKLFEAAGWPVDEKKRLKPGWSFRWLAGKTLKVKIEHEMYQDRPVERVAAVTRT